MELRVATRLACSNRDRDVSISLSGTATNTIFPFGHDPSTADHLASVDFNGVVTCANTMTLTSPTLGAVVFTKKSATVALPVVTSVDWQQQIEVQSG